ncbi:MAG: FecR domain-containing protein [Elusimicrobia bacterium]|nr:FecR domain-containing protein [Elusimicrobiota bacterium]
MRSAWGLAGLALLAAMAAMPAAAKGPTKPVAGIVVALEGKPEVKRAGSKSYGRLKMNDFVYEGEWLKTGKGERVAVAFIGGAEFKMNENSEFEVQSGGGSGQAASLKTTIGQAWTRMLHGLSGVKVKTPMAVAAVRGTEADIDLDDPTRLAVKVYEGHVDLLNASESKTLATLAANQMATVGDGGAVQRRAMGSGDHDSWQDGLQEDQSKLDGQLNKLKEEGERTKTLKWTDKDGNVHEKSLKHK